MTPTDRQTTFGTWHLPGRKPVIVYSHAVLAELAAAARNQGARPLGGVLFGRFDEGETRITRFRLVDCIPAEDDQNPFSSAGEAQLAEWTANVPAGDGWEGLRPVGWFRSRWQSEVQLCAEDLRIWNQYFHQVDQITLVLQVQGGGLPVRAGFFFRPQHGGPIRLGTSHRPFDVSEPGPGETVTEDMSHLARAVSNHPPPAAAAESLVLAAAPVESALTPPAELFTLPEATGPNRRWIWAATAATALVLAGVAWLVWPRALTFPPAAHEAKLRLNRGATGGLLVSWNPAATIVKRSQSAELMMLDGLNDSPRRIALGPSDLAQGSRNFNEAFGQNVQVRLNLTGGEAVATYVGPAIAAPLTPEQLKAAEAPLRAELAKLQKEIDGRSASNRKIEARIAAVRGLLTARGVAGPPVPPAVTPVSAPSEPQAKAPEPVAAAAAPAAPAAPTAIGEAVPQGSPFADRIPNRATLPALPPPPPPAAAYTGPTSGKFIWTGYLAPGTTVTLDGRRASAGSVTGGLPGVPVRLVVYPGELASGGLTVFTSASKHQGSGAAEPRSAQNGWLNTRYVYEPSRARDVQVVAGPNAAGAYKQMQIRGGDRPVSVVMVEWTVQLQ